MLYLQILPDNDNNKCLGKFQFVSVCQQNQVMTKGPEWFNNKKKPLKIISKYSMSEFYFPVAGLSF